MSSDRPVGRSVPVLVLMVPLTVAALVLGRLFSRRGLYVSFLALMLVRTLGGWLRPPLSGDMSSFALPLLGQATSDIAAPLMPGGTGFIWLSIGTVMAALIGVGAVVALVWATRFHLAAGLLLCGVMACLSSAAFNHPALIARLDQEHQQREELASVLQTTALPPVDITVVPRVQAPVAAGEQRGALLRGLYYLRYGGSLLLLAAMGLLLSTRGALSHRLGHLGLWLLSGLVMAGGVSCNRLAAEWHWCQALEADGRGELDVAERCAQASLERFPRLARLERTWLFLGRLDYRRGHLSPASDYFRAYQLSRNGELRRAIALTEELVHRGQPGRDAQRWLAELVARLALVEFQQGRSQAAEDLWQRAFELDQSQIFRPLFVAALRTRGERGNPDAIAFIADPLLSLMADRALRAALLAMIGDSYFEAGRFTEARARHRDAMAAYSLPKQINYRAQRGLTGM